MPDPIIRAAALQQVQQHMSGGLTALAACREVGISLSTYQRWRGRFGVAGVDGLADLPRSGRPPLVTLTEDEAKYLRTVYLRSNRSEGMGSMTLAARWSAKNPESPLRLEVREAILAARASKHCLPVEIRRACRAPEAEVARYRDARAGQNDGVYVPGWLRLDDQGRLLDPGHRWVGDDATVNTGIVVPWQRGGDKCADKWGVRLGRFQLLGWLDCATDLWVGYSFVMRFTDAYGAAEVVSGFHQVAETAGYLPNEVVLEGGAWQAERTLRYMTAAGVRPISAKGRPNQKLIEQAFDKLWTVLSVELPAYGQVGRYRGEMRAEKDMWMRCRAGTVDPRRHFPDLGTFLAALDRSLIYRNHEQRESAEYGRWVPSERYAAVAAKGHAIPSGIWRYALPVQKVVTLRRNGMAAVQGDSLFGGTHRYFFAAPDAYRYDGAQVRVCFDPASIDRGAWMELASPWRDEPAGRVIAESAECISRAPVLRQEAGAWMVGALDARDAGRQAKRQSLALVGAQVAAFDERGRRPAVVGVQAPGVAPAADTDVQPTVARRERAAPSWEVALEVARAG